MKIDYANSLSDVGIYIRSYPISEIIIHNEIYLADTIDEEKYEIEYIASIFYPLVKRYKKAIVIHITEQYAVERINVKYRVELENLSGKKFFITLNAFYRDIKVNRHYIYIEFFNPLLEHDLEILSHIDKNTLTIKNDCEILGFLKAVSNPLYRGCQSCLYYNEDAIFGCAVRPGHKELCIDYTKNKLPLYEDKIVETADIVQ
jgi:hypothetical protein